MFSRQFSADHSQVLLAEERQDGRWRVSAGPGVSRELAVRQENLDPCTETLE